MQKWKCSSTILSFLKERSIILEYSNHIIIDAAAELTIPEKNMFPICKTINKSWGLFFKDLFYILFYRERVIVVIS